MERHEYLDNLRLLLDQYAESGRLRALLAMASETAQDIEEALFEIRELLTVDTGEGEQLDLLGRVFGERREGRLDDEYREAIRGTATRRMSGSPEDIATALFAYFGATRVEYWRDGMASYTVETDAMISDDQLDALSPAGVKGNALTVDRSYLLESDEEPVPLVGGGYLYLMESEDFWLGLIDENAPLGLISEGILKAVGA